MKKILALIILSSMSYLAQAQTVPLRIELAHKCFFPMGDKKTAGASCVKQSKELKALNNPALPLEIHAACVEILDPALWNEVGCTNATGGVMGDQNEGGFFIEAFVTTPNYNAIRGQYIELAQSERSRIFSCPELATMFQDYSTNEALVSAKCDNISIFKNKITVGIELH